MNTSPDQTSSSSSPGSSKPAEPKSPSRLSTIATWSATIVRALEAQGLDGRAIAARAGIDTALLDDPEGRVPRTALTRLWKLAVEESGNPAFGLVAARHTVQTTFHALGYAVLASATLREAFERVIRYRRLLGDVMQLRLEEDHDRTRFVIDVSSGGGIVPWVAVDSFVAVLVRQARMLHGRDAHPLRVSMERPEPGDASPYERDFAAPVDFARDRTFVEYERELLDHRLPSANAELARQNDQVVLGYLARLEESGVLVRTRQAVLESLPSGAPTKAAIARRLAVSPRQLQRLLAEEGTTFQGLLAEARLTLARSYLDEGRLPVTEIAFVLGFADTSAFSRAFRRWTGSSPRDYAKGRPASSPPA